MTLQVAVIPVTPFQQNCTLVWNAESLRGAVVDPGGDVPQLLAAIKQAGITVTDIFLTHGHLDHAGGAAELAAALGVKITGPGVEDKFLLDGIAVQAKTFGFHAQNCTPDTWLREGDRVSMGGEEFEVLHCPGHTPGHMVFINHEANFGMVGDVLFRNSIGRTDFPYGDTDALLDAIAAKLLVLPDDFTFICGHGPNSTIGAEKRSNPFLR
ncbi:MBL fold metallo-hydrolase [Acidocella aquatica]|uniref:MBL fold metallo-hydrolase n=1 Tax=Acidocella aquatica TaxID=1922313 RepID=A0ABQ6A7Q9_9PROT|nr:MBL fold metallo-hydrolase [Acidocella aquatica]GLR66243.1 MBL fold metallo-hydrolase [Acidocella aquatica]